MPARVLHVACFRSTGGRTLMVMVCPPTLVVTVVVPEASACAAVTCCPGDTGEGPVLGAAVCDCGFCCAV